MSIFLLNSDDDASIRNDLERELLAEIPGLTETSSIESVLDVVSANDRAEPAIIIIAPHNGKQGSIEGMIDIVDRYRGHLFLILLSDDIPIVDYKRLVRTGAADWASATGGAREVIDIIARYRRQLRTAVPTAFRMGESRPPITISFVPSAGGVGNSTLIVESAVHLQKSAKASQRRICIIDLDFQTSHVCDYLDCEPRLRIAEFASAPARLDDHLFEIFTTRHSSGIDVLASPRSKFSAAGLDINALDALLNMIVKRYDLIFIDHPLNWFSWTSQVIAASDGIVVTGVNSIPCLRQISETVALVRSGSASVQQVGIALNRCERTLIGSVAHSQHARRMLQDEQIFFISHRKEALESVNMGIPMGLGTAATKLRREFATLAEFCAAIKSVKPGVDAP